MKINVMDYGAVGDGVADDTVPWNLAADAIRQNGGGKISAPGLPFSVTSIDMGGMTGFEVEGEGIPVNNVNNNGCTRIIPRGVFDVFDLTGSGGFEFRKLQVGKVDAEGQSQGRCAFKVAPEAGKPRQDNVFWEQVHVTGRWTACPLYLFGVNDGAFDKCRFWKYGGGAVAVITRDNVYGMNSIYRQVATGFQPAGNFSFEDFQLHDFADQGVQTYGTALWLRGVGSIKLCDTGQLSSTTQAVGTIYATDVDNTPSEVSLNGITLYSEAPPAKANYSYYVEPGSTLYIKEEADCSFDHAIAKSAGQVVYV